MRFENTSIDNQIVELSKLTEVMQEHGFILAGQWDYERVTYDYKFEVLHETYYLRVQGYATEGEIGSHHATIKLLTPLLGKHYYPHGVEYGEGETFPQAVTQKSEQLLKKVSEALQALSQAE